MAESIDSIKANIRKGFARPNLFTVDLGNVKAAKALEYRLNCFQAQLPGNTIATTDKDDGFRSVAYKKVFADIILGFYCSGDLKELKFFQDWIDIIVDKNTNQFSVPEKYIWPITITQYNRQWGRVAEWKLSDAYPKQVDAIQLDYGTNNTVMTCNVTMTYRHYDVTYFNGEIPDIVEKRIDIQGKLNFNQKAGDAGVYEDPGLAQHLAEMKKIASQLQKNTTGGALNMTNEVAQEEY